ncbi:MAG: maleylpyruvate isomerase family mycothiol-dependent enzyme [Acidimicrobiia bacterium]|nr:maleylpyruvate isomerase family mycothiol-dependent enzyme [Acidimicrobiia bacterium]
MVSNEGPQGQLGAHEHVEWTAEEIDRLLAVSAIEVDEPTPTCPGWTVASVLDHLARGAGIGWATWFREDADIDGMAVMTGLPPATTGIAARSMFHRTMPDYVHLLRATAPDKGCFWFSGPVPAAYLFRLGAVEIATHRADVDLALGRTPELPLSRAVDAVQLSAEFMPNLWSRRGEAAPPPLRLAPSDGPPTTVGAGTPVAVATGTSTDLWLRLWGRPANNAVTIEGDHNALDRWAESSPAAPF